jgi:SET domain-containing protein
MEDHPRDIPDRIMVQMKEVLAYNGSKSTEPTRKDNKYHTSANSVLFNFRSYINHNRN